MSSRILITGAASGIGAAAAAEFKRRGVQVAGLDVNASSGDVIECDVRDQGSVNRAVAEAVERLGGLDVVINNAGLATPQSAGRPPDEKALAVIDVNLLGPWRVTAAALPSLQEARGRVVNIASGMAFVALPFSAAYAMSKHGVVAYSGALRLEMGNRVSVTTVYPGIVETPIHRDSEAFGLSIVGTSPTESMESAVDALIRAALGSPARRDITTTASGKVSGALSRFLPRSMVDRIVLASFRRRMKGRSFDHAAPEVAEFAARLNGATTFANAPTEAEREESR